LVKYRPDIDGLRALAVLAVTLYHFSLVSVLSGGFVGVDIFYVISGFLITLVIEGQVSAGTFTIRKFYVARIRRLAPSLFATLIFVFGAGILLLFPDDLVSLAKETVAAQTYTANIFYWRTVNYFGLQANSAFLLHTWSLAVEEQFYLLYPLCFVIIYRLPRRFMLSLFVLVMVGSFCLNLMFVSIKPEATFYLLPTRAWELLLGATVAFLKSPKRFPNLLNNAVSALGMALIVISLFAFRPEFQFPGLYALLPTLGTAAVLFAGPSETLKLLSTAPVVYLGKISYPLYLVHWPVAVFAERGLLVDRI
jgi:peptidoglycan/LPS O-acetylase OafA/YrhL